MGVGEDRISGLPDELLHYILVRLGSARDAVRTRVLSRRWRHILGPLPELLLDGDPDAPPPPPSVLDKIDTALAACNARIVKRLDIDFAMSSVAIADDGRGIPAMRAARWLRFVSERVVDDFYVYLPRPEVDDGKEEAVLELPACEAVKSIQLMLERTWRIQPPAVGLFRELTDLTMHCGSMDGRELTALVCAQCPCLVHLKIYLTQLVNSLDVSIRSDSLRSLLFKARIIRGLEIVAPRLEKLSLSSADIDKARISAPKLAELVWSYSVYDPRRHQFDGVGRRLRTLEPSQNISLV
ncbi:hypothetical protein HU200_048658 [Digitaria exilis]|uniref:F-box domain-containing protein n=1 Tax=Digitaria exilis TaxID=1010633 RepID=A0A835B189_9POAL|nr:hypothetical protein HU200_048658 [Digitaria exilis]